VRRPSCEKNAIFKSEYIEIGIYFIFELQKKKKNYKTEPKGGTGELINMEKNKQTNEMKEKKSLEK
jgi:hypothetical protein